MVTLHRPDGVAPDFPGMGPRLSKRQIRRLEDQGAVAHLRWKAWRRQ